MFEAIMTGIVSGIVAGVIVAIVQFFLIRWLNKRIELNITTKQKIRNFSLGITIIIFFYGWILSESALQQIRNPIDIWMDIAQDLFNLGIILRNIGLFIIIDFILYQI